jgi:lipoprotein-anchoring transpeptidase ErfK/SrfK
MAGTRVRRIARATALVVGLPAVTLGALLAIHVLTGPAAAERPVAPVGASPAAAPARALATMPTCNVRPTLIGTVVSPRVVVRTSPSWDARPIGVFDRIDPEGSPQVFLLQRRAGAWYEALLPVRPNGTMGYIPAKEVSLSTTTYRLVVDRGALRLTLWKGCERLATYPVAVGKPSTPTPAGTFYLDALMKPRSPDTVYGEYAYGLSGYSNVIKTWRWGGVIGLHGTNDPASIGHPVSHGCIRLQNQDIAALVRILPLGTPIAIR